jgi:DNA-binding Lrp family transcriptional regulator
MSVKTLIKKLKRDVIIRRYKVVSGNKINYQATATVDGAFQELDQQARVALGLTQGRAWICYVDIINDSVVYEGDQVEIDSRQYKVQEKTVKNYGINQHIELILFEYDDAGNS